jgi:hypothetical protein
MNLSCKGITVAEHHNKNEVPIEQKNTDELSFIKLHSTLCLLMTQFHKHQCPKLAHFIIRHIRLVIEHPNVADSCNSKTLYLQLFQEWQVIGAALSEHRRNLAAESKSIH